MLFSIAIVPQIIKTIKTKTTTRVSDMLFIINLVANIIALVYAVLIDQLPLQIKYVVGISVSVIYLIVYYKYKFRPSAND